MSSNKVEAYPYEEPGAMKTDPEKMRIMQIHIDAHVRRIEELRQEFDVSPSLKREWKRVNRSSDHLARTLKARDIAVVVELANRDVEAEARVMEQEAAEKEAEDLNIPEQGASCGSQFGLGTIRGRLN